MALPSNLKYPNRVTFENNLLYGNLSMRDLHILAIRASHGLGGWGGPGPKAELTPDLKRKFPDIDAPLPDLHSARPRKRRKDSRRMPRGRVRSSGLIYIADLWGHVQAWDRDLFYHDDLFDGKDSKHSKHSKDLGWESDRDSGFWEVDGVIVID